MTRLLPIPILFALAACQSTSYQPDRVDPALLRFVDGSARDDIAGARRARDEAVDALAAARENLARSRGELQIARDDRVVAEAKLAKAKTEMRVERHAAGIQFDRNPDGVEYDGDEYGAQDAELRGPRAEVLAADDRIQWHKEIIAAAECDVELAKAKLDLAEARVTLEEARAVHKTDRPEAADLDLVAIERACRAQQTEVDVCRVRCDAAAKEVELAKGRVEESPRKRLERLEKKERRVDGGEGY